MHIASESTKNHSYVKPSSYLVETGGNRGNWRKPLPQPVWITMKRFLTGGNWFPPEYESWGNFLKVSKLPPSCLHQTSLNLEATIASTDTGIAQETRFGTCIPVHQSINVGSWRICARILSTISSNCCIDMRKFKFKRLKFTVKVKHV